MQGKIKIVGQIGSGVNDDGTLAKGYDLIDAQIAVRDLPEGTTDILLQINSPGGYVEAGNEIADYFQNVVKKNFKVNTSTLPGPDGRALVGSIATRIFGIGEEREIGDQDEFFIHLPLYAELKDANSDKLQMALDAIRPDETALLNFYATLTNNSVEALRPLMAAQTSMTGTQAIKMGFATKLKKSKPVFAIKNNMAKTIGQSLDELIAKIKGEAAAPAPKASVEMKTADGKSVVSDAADEAGLKGSSVTVDGQPAADGDIKLDNGKTLKVAAGKITDVVMPADPAPAAKIDALEQNVAKLSEAVALLTDLNKKNQETTVATIAQQIVALKNEIVSGGKPNPGGKKEGDETEHRAGSAFEKRRAEILANKKK